MDVRARHRLDVDSAEEAVRRFFLGSTAASSAAADTEAAPADGQPASAAAEAVSLSVQAAATAPATATAVPTTTGALLAHTSWHWREVTVRSLIDLEADGLALLQQL